MGDSSDVISCDLAARERSQDLRVFGPLSANPLAFHDGTVAAVAAGMSDKILSYRDLIVWQKAMDLAILVYSITAKFPESERFGLALQMRKATVSVPSNIAEGTRHRRPGYLQRVIIALGEHAELETQTMIARRRRYISAEDMAAFTELATQVGELAHGLRRSLDVPSDD